MELSRVKPLLKGNDSEPIWLSSLNFTITKRILHSISARYTRASVKGLVKNYGKTPLSR